MGTDDGGEQEIPEEVFHAATKALHEEDLRLNAELGYSDSEEDKYKDDEDDDEEIKAARRHHLGFPVEYLPEDPGSQ